VTAAEIPETSAATATGTADGVDGETATAGRRMSADILDLSDRSVSLEIALSVSKTPGPFVAEASYHSIDRSWFRAAFNSSTERMLPRSRLLYWKTRGSVSSPIPISARFSRRFFRLSRFGSAIGRCESATKTMPSTPFRTSFRVVL
jgi:hypothetical protein